MINKKICIIPIRSKSKEIPNKNIKKIYGIPLICFSLQSCIDSKVFNEIRIACDSDEYISYLKKIIKNHLNITFFKRSKKSSKDNSQTEEVLLEVLKKKKIKNTICALVQATSPLINKKDIKEAFSYFLKKKFDSLFTSYQTKKFCWKKNTVNYSPLKYNFKKRKMRQRQKNFFIENGALYIFQTKNLKKYNSRLHKNIGTFLMEQKKSLEIDNYNDLDESILILSGKKNIKTIYKRNFNL